MKSVYGPDPYTPEDFASNFGVPLAAVHEALDYVRNNLPLIRAERAHEAADSGHGASLDLHRDENPDRRETEQPASGRAATRLAMARLDS